MQFDTKIAIIVRDDLQTWQKLNVTSFLTSGIIGANQEIIGAPYEDASGNTYHSLSRQPVIVLSADAAGMKKIHERGLNRNTKMSLYIEDMFATGHDEANRAVVKQYSAEDLNIVGIAVHDDKKTVDKITKGARMHS